MPHCQTDGFAFLQFFYGLGAICVHTSVNPFLWIWITAGEFIDFQNQFFYLLVISAVSIGHGKIKKPLAFLLILLLQQLSKHLLAQKLKFPLLSGAKARLYINSVKMILHNRQTEAVNRGNPSIMYQSCLLFQMLIVRTFYQLLLDRPPNPLLHLSGSSFGKCHN